MASDIGPQFPSTPQYFCLWLKSNHMSSRTLQVVAGLSKDRTHSVHMSTVRRGYPAFAAAATLIGKNFRIVAVHRAGEISTAQRSNVRVWSPSKSGLRVKAVPLGRDRM